MQPTHLHSWDVDESEAKKIQLRLAPLVVSQDDFSNVDLIGSVSVRPVDATIVQAAVCVLDVATMKVADSTIAQAQSAFGYVSGFRAFQSGPAILAAFEKLQTPPDVVLWDGHGIAHPRRCGLASHLGVLLDMRRDEGLGYQCVIPATVLRLALPYAPAAIFTPSMSASGTTCRWNQR